METRACVLYGQEDVRIETREVGEVGPTQVLIRIGAGGVCGSDIHYYWEGGIGTIRVTEPIVMGHEVAGTVEAVGERVTRVRPGDRVAVSPSRPCGRCKFCLAGEPQHCLDMQFFGSAMRKPHTHGGFRDRLVAEDVQCEPMGNEVSLGEAACTEPLAVGVHAVKQAGSLLGKRVLVTGAGPIGALLIGAARVAGAQEIVAMDISEAPLKAALQMGANVAINAAQEPDRLSAEYSADKGYFDVVFECTGVGGVLKQAFPVIRPRGTIVQVGVTGSADIPINALVGKEIRLVGTHRFHPEYAVAARLIREKRIDVRPVITTTLPMERIAEAFAIARDRSSQMKVQLSFG
ncbi:L-idonate 5-dehydrogenase [Propionivibrio dicarboxylicus]|uniref:L-idonate 5-dehydrogenase n=1 Tax=Propionivibrio dicarboxylicus TaxID=83767 RepID=A0A1G8KJZ4_9RHOO|nr:L-idonate 5-dehydrogenase [Propionivibrio dicarboxylicus]SDI43719.1 L-idonate 5-dehydrogenase [Propionivibrio dicarboxylicus]